MPDFEDEFELPDKERIDALEGRINALADLLQEILRRVRDLEPNDHPTPAAPANEH